MNANPKPTKLPSKAGIARKYPCPSRYRWPLMQAPDKAIPIPKTKAANINAQLTGAM